MKGIREILKAIRKAIIITLTGVCLILLIPTIYGYFNQADLNNITDRKYKRENSQYLVTSISKDDYYYFDIYQDERGIVWTDIYENKVGIIDNGEASEWLRLPDIVLKSENIRTEWEKGKLENGNEYDVVYLIIDVNGEVLAKLRGEYYK
ncbi:MAG: hypothetical protein Q3988_01460 [Gemella sp.]|nr:hypothetical protein [Gemella sp.]